MALLQAGTGPSASLLAAWTSDGQQWRLSPAFRLGGAHPVSVSFGSDGATAVVLSGHRGETLAGPGASWRALPPLPSGRTVTLALPAAGTTDALAADGSSLTAWQLRPGSAAWARTQTIKVPHPVRLIKLASLPPACFTWRGRRRHERRRSPLSHPESTVGAQACGPDLLGSQAQ